jgi:chromosomal replication initiation ATPase DnaA
MENPFEAVQWQAVLGDEPFVQKLRDRVKGLHKQGREITSLRKAVRSIDAEKILQKVAEEYQVDRRRLVARSERGLQARNVAMWMIWEKASKSLREIGELFGALDYAAVAQRVRRTRASHDAAAAQKLIDSILNV